MLQGCPEARSLPERVCKRWCATQHIIFSLQALLRRVRAPLCADKIRSGWPLACLVSYRPLAHFPTRRSP